MAEMYVGTIYGYCLNLLQSHIPEYFKYQVLTDIQARILVDRYSKVSGLTSMVSATGTQMKRYTNSSLYMSVLSHCERLRSRRITEEHLSPDEADRLEMCRLALDSYQTLLEDRRYLDYTEIMVLTVAALFRHEDQAPHPGGAHLPQC